MKIYTIGFTKKSAQTFFGLLRDNQVGRVIDVRLNPGGQLAGFAKQADLAFFLKELLGCEYYHFEFLAPSEELIKAYRQDKDWDRYVPRFETLMDQRDVMRQLEREFFAEKPGCLLCSEDQPDKCHRRLVAERMARSWENTQIIHLT